MVVVSQNISVARGNGTDRYDEQLKIYQAVPRFDQRNWDKGGIAEAGKDVYWFMRRLSEKQKGDCRW